MALRGSLVDCYRGRRVLVTGHTGFKGGWLAASLKALEAEVLGYALPSVVERPGVNDLMRSVTDEFLGDVRDGEAVLQRIRAWRPSVIFHLAAQPLVRASYEDPTGTFSTNVMGIVNVLEAVRYTPEVRVVVVITTDKCYSNREWYWPYRETDHLGGADPYSASKACAELVAESYRRSFFGGGRCALATARAGNVIGGGDWSQDRIVPDLVRSFIAGSAARLRNPSAIRPFQHVMDAVGAYLLLGGKLLSRPDLADSYNFGPWPGTELSVRELAAKFAAAWGGEAVTESPDQDAPHESRVLRLDSSKAMQVLGWSPTLSNEEMIKQTVEWYRAAVRDVSEAAKLTLVQAEQYLSTCSFPLT